MAELTANGHRHEPQLSLHQALHIYTDLLHRITYTREGMTFGGDRDLYKTLGFKRTLAYADFYERYRRGGIAARLIDAFPSATWRLTPRIQEVTKDDESTPSAFEQAWETLATRLGIWEVFARADRLATLGAYGVIVLGLRNQTDWGVPVSPVSVPGDLVYLNAFSQEHAGIQSLVSDASSPLFGQPSTYAIDFSRKIDLNVPSPMSSRPALESGDRAAVRVHASRVIHIAENGFEDNIIGTPRLEAVWNYLDSLDKVLGGAGEMFWQDAKRRFALSLRDGATLSPEEATHLSAEVDEFVHEFRNFLRVQGMDVTQFGGQIADPSSHVDRLLDVIAGTVGIPKRLLIGSERGETGELSRSQDETNWTNRIQERDTQYAEPRILRPFLDRVISLRVLPVPRDGYRVAWPSRFAQTEEEKARVALTRTQALREYAGGLGSPRDILPLEVYLPEIFGMSKEQTDRILDLLAEPAFPNAMEASAV